MVVSMTSASPLAMFLLAHGSLLILPLAIFEGPVVSVVAGTLAARGFVIWYEGLAMLFAGDVLGDTLYYAIGRSGSTPLAVLGRFVGLRPTLSPQLVEGLRANAAKMLVIGKWTHSVGVVVLIGAGMLRLNLRKYLLVNTIATVPKSALLFGVGYFAWTYWALIEGRVWQGLILLLVIGVTAVIVVLRRGPLARNNWAGR